MNTTPPSHTLSRSSFLRTLTVGLPLLPALALKAQTSDSRGGNSEIDAGNLRAFIELTRSDLKTQKAIVVAQNLPLNDEEAAEFWPLEREYQEELTKLNDQKLAAIREFAAYYGHMTDDKARELAKKSFDLEEKKTDLKRKYFKKLAKVVPATKAARFFQIENQLNAVLDLQVAASLPLIK